MDWAYAHSNVVTCAGMTSPCPSRPRGTHYPQPLQGLHTLRVKTLILGLILTWWTHIPSMACTTPSYSDPLLAIVPSAYRERHVPAHLYRNEEPSVGSEPHVRDYYDHCTLQCSFQEQQRIDDLHAAYAAWNNGALPMDRPSPPIAARPSTRDAAVAGGDAFIIIILLYLFFNTAQLIMLPVISVALLLMATPASAEQEPGSTRGSSGPGDRDTSTMCSLILMFALGVAFAKVMRGRRYRQAHGQARLQLLPAGDPYPDFPNGPPDEYLSFRIDVGPIVLDVQSRDPKTGTPVVANGYNLRLSNTSASKFLGVKVNLKHGITSYTARTGTGQDRLCIGTYDCPVQAALQRSMALGDRADPEVSLPALGDIGSTDWAGEWERPERSSGAAVEPAEQGPGAAVELAESTVLRISPAGVVLHLSERSSTGYTGVSITKVNHMLKTAGANYPRSTERWYSAKYRGQFLKRTGGRGNFRTLIDAAEAYARAFAADQPENRAKVLKHGGETRHRGAWTNLPEDWTADSAAQSVAESPDEAAVVNEQVIDVAASPLRPGEPGFDPDFQALVDLCQSTPPFSPPPQTQPPPSPPSSPPSLPSSRPASPPGSSLRWLMLSAMSARGACSSQEPPALEFGFSGVHFLWIFALLTLAALLSKWGPVARARSATYDRVARISDRITTFAAFDASVFAATAAGTTVSPVHGSLRVPHQVPGGYCRRLLPVILISCLAQGCFADEHVYIPAQMRPREQLVIATSPSRPPLSPPQSQPPPLQPSSRPPPMPGPSSPPPSPPPSRTPPPLCAICGADARCMIGDALSCQHCGQTLCPEHFPPEMHCPCRSPPSTQPPSRPPPSPQPPCPVTILPSPTSRQGGLLGGSDRNHDFLMVGARVRRMDRYGIAVYDILDVDVVQRHAYVARSIYENLPQGVVRRIDLVPRMRIPDDETLLRTGQWQLFPNGRSIVPRSPSSYVCNQCLAESSHRPCVSCSGKQGPDHCLVLSVVVLDAQVVPALAQTAAWLAIVAVAFAAIVATAFAVVAFDAVAAFGTAAAIAATAVAAVATADATFFVAAFAAVLAVASAFAATAASTTASPVHGSMRVPHQVPGGYCRRLLPTIIISCLAQGCFAGAPDAEMMAQLTELSSSFGLAALLTGLASIAVTPDARKLIGSAAEACSITSDSPLDEAATRSEKEGAAPMPLPVKMEGVALPPGLNVNRPRTRSDKEGAGTVTSAVDRSRRTSRSTAWARRGSTEWTKQPHIGIPLYYSARQPVFTTAHCASVWLQRTLAARARRRDTISRPPVPLSYDVGFDANCSMLTYRDVRGRMTYDHPAQTGATPNALDADGHEVAPVQPPRESSVVLAPESTGRLCYYDTQTGIATWFPPPGSGPLEHLTRNAVTCLPQRLPPQLPKDLSLGMMQTSASGWLAIFKDAIDSVTFYHVATGTLREAPWIALRTPCGVVYFGNLVSRETRWLPPRMWQEGFISRHSLNSSEDPYDQLANRGLIDHRTPLPMQLARMRIEGGAPYCLDEDSGTPTYPPDAFDTPCTYPLADYVSVKCSRSHFGETLWVPKSATDRPALE